MASEVFYRKWRPQLLAEVVGQEQVTRTLLSALATGRISHAYLFCGPRGTGKTSSGRILAKAVNCLTTEGKEEPCNTCSICQEITGGQALDVIEIDAASNRGIDEIRNLREKTSYSPNQARYKVYIIDEVHMLTKEASNALLKTLEEPPLHIIFILATTETHKLLPTILSRCQRFDFRRISQVDVVSKLTHICETENIQIEPEALRLIAKATTGSLRDAENLLQQLTTYYGSAIELQQVQSILGISGDSQAKEVIGHIVNNDVSAGVATINRANNDGLDLRQFNRELVENLRSLLLIKTGSGENADLTAEDKKEFKELAGMVSLPQLLKAIKLFGQLEIGFDNYSTLPLELAMVESTLAPAEKSEEKKELVSCFKPEPTDQTKPVIKPTPVPSPAKVEEKPALPSELDSEIERMRQKWKQLIQEAPNNYGRTPAAALLRTASAKAIEDDTVVLSFRYKFHIEKMEKIENLKIAEKIISSFLERSCQLRCIYEEEDNHLVRAAQKIGAQIIDAEE